MSNINRQLLAMVREKRLQGFLMPAETFRHFLPEFPMLQGYNAQFIAKLPVTLLINRKQAAIIPALDRAIRSLQAQGVVDDIFKAYFGRKTEAEDPFQ